MEAMWSFHYFMIWPIFPMLINTGWGVSVIDPKLTSDGVKAEFRHELPKAIGEWIFLLIKGDDTPKNIPISYRESGQYNPYT